MRVLLLLIVLLLPLVSGQNDTTAPDIDAGNETEDPDDGGNLWLVVNSAVAVLLVGAFVYVARR